MSAWVFHQSQLDQALADYERAIGVPSAHRIIQHFLDSAQAARLRMASAAPSADSARGPERPATAR